jgi:prophage antirepressor-like protein
MMTDSTAEPTQAQANGSTEIINVFNYEDKKIRVAGTALEPWFCGKDIAEILGYKNPTASIGKHVDTDDKMTYESLLEVCPNQTYLEQANKNDLKSIYINESGVYSLVLRSKLPAAKEFKKWITKIVLPSIRKNGYYVSPELSNENLAKLQTELDETKKKLADSERKSVNLNRFTASAKMLEKKEKFYIATSPIYARSSLFKYGGIGQNQTLKARLSTYNSSHVENDKFYFASVFECNSFRHIENCLSQLTSIFKDKDESKKEMIHMRYNCLIELVEFIIDNNDKSIEFINNNIQKYLKDTIELDAIIPTPIDLGRSIVKYQIRSMYQVGRKIKLKMF